MPTGNSILNELISSYYNIYDIEKDVLDITDYSFIICLCYYNDIQFYVEFKLDAMNYIMITYFYFIDNKKYEIYFDSTGSLFFYAEKLDKIIEIIDNYINKNEKHINYFSLLEINSTKALKINDAIELQRINKINGVHATYLQVELTRTLIDNYKHTYLLK